MASNYPPTTTNETQPTGTSTYIGYTSTQGSTTGTANTLIPGPSQIIRPFQGLLTPAYRTRSDDSLSTFAKQFNVDPTDKQFYRLTTNPLNVRPFIRPSPLSTSVYVDTHQRELNDQRRFDELRRWAGDSSLLRPLHQDPNRLLDLAGLAINNMPPIDPNPDNDPYDQPRVPTVPLRPRPPSAAIQIQRAVRAEVQDQPQSADDPTIRVQRARHAGPEDQDSDENEDIEQRFQREALQWDDDWENLQNVDPPEGMQQIANEVLQEDERPRTPVSQQHADNPAAAAPAQPNPAPQPAPRRAPAPVAAPRRILPVDAPREPRPEHPGAHLVKPPGHAYVPNLTNHWINSHYGNLGPRLKTIPAPPLLANKRLEIADPIQQHINNLKATQQTKQTTFDALSNTNAVLLHLLNYVTTGTGNPVQLAQLTQQNMNNLAMQQMTDSTADKLETSDKLRQVYEAKLRMPPLSVYNTTDPDLLKAKNVLAAVSIFDPDKNKDQDFTSTWNEILRYTRGHALSEQNYIDLLFYVLKGSPRQDLLEMTNNFQTSLSGILDHFYDIYCKRRTMEDDVSALRTFTRKANEGIRECMARAKHQVAKLRQTTMLLHGSYTESENAILQSILFAVLLPPTRAAIEMERRQRQKYGAASSLDVLTQFVIDYETAHQQIPSQDIPVTGLYLPSHLAHLAATPPTSVTPTVTQTSKDSDVTATLRELTTFVAKMAKDGKVRKPKHRTDNLTASNNIIDLAADLKAATDRTRSRSASPSTPFKALPTPIPSLSPSTTSNPALPGNQMEWFGSTPSRTPPRTDERRKRTSSTHSDRSSSRSHRRSDTEERRRRARDDSRDRHRDTSPSPQREHSSAERRRSHSPDRRERTSSPRRYTRSSSRDRYRSPSRDRTSSSSRYTRSSDYRPRTSSVDRYDRSYRSTSRSSSPDRSNSYRAKRSRSYDSEYTGQRRQWQGRLRQFHTPKTFIVVDDRPKYKCKNPNCHTVHLHKDQYDLKTNKPLN